MELKRVDMSKNLQWLRTTKTEAIATELIELPEQVDSGNGQNEGDVDRMKKSDGLLSN